MQPFNRSTVQPTRAGRWLVWFGAALLTALIVLGLIPQPAPVETARAVRGSLRASVSEEGKTRIKQRYVVAAPVIGQLRRIPFKPGDEILASQTVVAVIDPLTPAMLDARTRATTEARRLTALANLEKARSTRVFADNELKRTERLHADNTISLDRLEAAQTQAATAAQDVAAAESALRQVEAELAEFDLSHSVSSLPGPGPVEVRAPCGGRVLRVFEESTRVVGPGTPLVEIGDPADLEAVIEVLSRDGAVIAPGTRVELEQWGGSEPLQGHVRLVEPAAFTKISALGVEEQRVNVVVDFDTPFEQRRNLGDNFRVEGRIMVWETGDTLKVPSGALFRHGQSWAAFVVVDGRARLREVQAGRSSGTEVQVLGGLKENDEVILYPGDRIRDGQRVRPVKI